jgi:hypothetical protein
MLWRWIIIVPVTPGERNAYPDPALTATNMIATNTRHRPEGAERPTATTPLKATFNGSAGSGTLLQHNTSTIVDDFGIEAETNAS